MSEKKPSIYGETVAKIIVVPDKRGITIAPVIVKPNQSNGNNNSGKK